MKFLSTIILTLIFTGCGNNNTVSVPKKIKTKIKSEPIEVEPVEISDSEHKVIVEHKVDLDLVNSVFETSCRSELDELYGENGYNEETLGECISLKLDSFLSFLAESSN